jgi:hypothetical protein
MPSRSWFVQIYSVDGKPKASVVFTDCEQILAFIDEFKNMRSADTLTVYLPESTTNEQEKVFDELDAKVGVRFPSGDHGQRRL